MHIADKILLSWPLLKYLKGTWLFVLKSTIAVLYIRIALRIPRDTAHGLASVLILPDGDLLDLYGWCQIKREGMSPS